MSAPREPRDSQNAIQNTIIDDLRRRILGVRKGASVTREDGSTHVFATTIRKAYENPESVTSLDDWQLPAAIIWLGGEETLERHSTGYSTTWGIDVGVVLRNEQETDEGEIALVPRMLNVAKVDLMNAIHHLPGEYPIGTAVNPCIAWNVTKWVIDGYDSRIGMGTLSIAAKYNEYL